VKKKPCERAFEDVPFKSLDRCQKGCFCNMSHFLLGALRSPSVFGYSYQKVNQLLEYFNRDLKRDMAKERMFCLHLANLNTSYGGGWQ
jgi:hypothetical protein